MVQWHGTAMPSYFIVVDSFQIKNSDDDETKDYYAILYWSSSTSLK